ncbi:hypothetical protein ACXYMX_13560 [Sporosarcina sp. CAU 1771]
MENAEYIAEQPVSAVRNQVIPQMSVGQWVITFVLLAIPLVNIIMMFIWAFDPNSLRRNFARAYLIIAAIMIALSIVFGIIMVVIGASSGIFNSF